MPNVRTLYHHRAEETMITYLIINMIALGILYELVSRAPEGYQDEKGFHYGKGVDKD